MKKNIPFTLILLAIAAFLALFRPDYGLKLKYYLEPNFRGSGAGETNLAAENEGLKAELAELKNIKDQLPARSQGYLAASVYSRYPMNFKNELLIDAGKNDGVTEGAAVLGGGIFIGRIEDVFGDSAIVQTVFDSRFQTPVRIGETGVDSLFKGGSLPAATLIPLDAKISPGDIVYSASADYPYSLPIGEIGKISPAKDQLFNEASVNFAYDINKTTAVLVKKMQ